MNTEIQKKVKERQNKKQKQSMKGQSSIEYPMMIAIALIVIAIAIVVILSVGGKTAKAGTIHAELLSAEVSGTGGNTILSIATNLPLKIGSSVNGNITYNQGIMVMGQEPVAGNYNVTGGFEYEIELTGVGAGTTASLTGGNPIGDQITSMTITQTSGVTALLLPASGTSVTITGGKAPFVISNIGSS